MEFSESTYTRTKEYCALTTGGDVKSTLTIPQVGCERQLRFPVNREANVERAISIVTNCHNTQLT